MSSVSEASLSFLQSTVPPNHTFNIALGITILTWTAFMIYHASPMRLTGILVKTLHETEETHLRAIEAGILSGSDDHTKMLLNLQIKVSLIREASLYNSLSSGQMLRELIKGRSLTLLRCIWELQALKTRIEILRERQSRGFDPGARVLFRGRHIRSKVYAILMLSLTLFSQYLVVLLSRGLYLIKHKIVALGTLSSPTQVHKWRARGRESRFSCTADKSPSANAVRRRNSTTDAYLILVVIARGVLMIIRQSGPSNLLRPRTRRNELKNPLARKPNMSLKNEMYLRRGELLDSWP
ncbi:hypothetical protein C8F04DRAFT_1073299 [Mycena alexandri]|uniref:Transmembrane protein n=1 Tax=Mycena alexandri TaxID=1745969 RepID=A0AAD6TD77_9AGAR|nr:hypothetical protein C8F04DRAFT_1073299 [Mycena alexandri]